MLCVLYVHVCVCIAMTSLNPPARLVSPETATAQLSTRKAPRQPNCRIGSEAMADVALHNPVVQRGQEL